ncbi:MAG: hypothetical protein FJZ16_04635 [Candidatus Omnitrophica bacterium]|nr:hypothetical protein [Candidatus Omnitrophota bacterium]
MDKKILCSQRAPKPKGPYSQGIIYNGIMYISGQIPIEPKTGKIISETIEGQTKRVLENLKAIVEDSGSKMKEVLKVTCYLSDMNDLEGFNKIYTEYFPEQPPARTTVCVARLPMNVKVEIDAIVKLNQDI